MRTILMLGLLGACGVCSGQDADQKPAMEGPDGRLRIFQMRNGVIREARVAARVLVEMEPASDDPKKLVVAMKSFDVALTRRMDSADWQSRWDEMLYAQLRRDAKIYKLTSDDVRKLQAAVNGDSKRLRDRVESARSEFDSIRNDADKACQFLDQTVYPMRLELERGFLAEDTLYRKVLRKILRRMVEAQSD